MQNFKQQASVMGKINNVLFRFFSSIGVYICVTESGKMIEEYGNEMSILRSQAGTSIAEYYYRLHGEIYSCLGSAIQNIMGLFLIAGIIISFFLVPEIFQIIKIKKNKEKNSSISQEIVINQQESSSQLISCNNCGTNVNPKFEYCPNCGQPINEQCN